MLNTFQPLTLDARAIAALPYPQLVALLPVENTPPGGSRTVDNWIRSTRIDEDSYVLDLACNTAFSSRRIALRTPSRVQGIDISEVAVLEARRRAHAAGIDARTRYDCADATELPFSDGTFTHVVAGCSFAFIANRETALDEAARVLTPHGALCVATYFFSRRPPTALLDRVEQAIGYRPDPNRTAEVWEAFFSRRFERQSEQRFALTAHPREAINDWVHRVVRASTALNTTSDVNRAAFVKRLESLRLVLNEQRRFQGVSVSTWRSR
jgi:ubiquinone/menaquinone biosynthesis C-methylase UbiE